MASLDWIPLAFGLVVIGVTIFHYFRTPAHSENEGNAEKSQKKPSNENQNLKFSNFIASDIMNKPKELIFVNSNEKIPDALKKLVSNNITSVPVFDQKQNKYIGSVDMLDLVGVMVSMAKTKDLADVFAKREIPWKEFIIQEKKVFFEQTIDGIPNLATHNVFVSVSEKTNFSEILQQMKKDADIHRIYVSNGKLVGVISSFDVFSFIYKNLNKIPQSNMKISEFFRENLVVSVRPQTKTIDALTIMLENKVTAIGIVNPKNHALVSVLSSTDLKRSSEEDLFSDLFLPVDEYLKKNNKGKFNRNESTNPVSVTLNQTFSDALELLVKTKLHRLFVIDSSRRLIGAITLYDVLQVLQIN